MALKKELFILLDDTSEPLQKRLKIADNAFKSSELRIPHHEFLLLRWIGSLNETNAADIWPQCKQWITSEQFKSLNQNDISMDDFSFITNIISKTLKVCTDHKTIEEVVTCAISLIENRCFQQHFKCDLSNYCKYISNIIRYLHNEELFLKVIANGAVFTRQYITLDKFTLNFFIILRSLGIAALKFKTNEAINEEIVKVVQKCLFQKGFKGFADYFNVIFNGDTMKLPYPPKVIIKQIISLYNSLHAEKAASCYKIIFHAFCKSYSSDFSMIYKFLVLLTSTLGFDIVSRFGFQKNPKTENTKASLEKSLEILVGLFEITSKINCSLDVTINSISFAEYLQSIVQTIISITKSPNGNCYSLLLSTLIINPLVIEPLMNSVIAYTMLVDNSEWNVLYEKLMIAIFEVFSKLHRVQNLISKMIPALKEALEGNAPKVEENIYVFQGSLVVETKCAADCVYDIEHIFPAGVLQYFTKCITSLASWQVMNLYKTLLFHLGTTLQDDLQTISCDNKKVLYVEVICTLLAHFLSSVRTAEYTVSSVVLEKFVKSMEEQKEILAKFGSALVSLEHNRKLMRCYLNICYVWAELYIVLTYYSFNNEVAMKRQLDLDYSACNITYLHSYLTSEQWCLISQRINNFGEKPCKQIMEKLCVQKLRAMLMFEPQIPEEVISAVTKNATNSLEDFYEDIINDKFCLSTLVSNMDCVAVLKISEYIIKDVSKSQNYDHFKNIVDSKVLSVALLYSCIRNISKLFRFKRKHGEFEIPAFVNTKIVTELAEEEFFDGSINLNGKCEIIKNSFSIKEVAKNANVKLNEDKISDLLEVVKRLPIMQLTENTQSILFIFLSSLLIDFKGIEIGAKLQNQVENLLIGVYRHGVVELPISPNDLITYSYINRNVGKYLNIFDRVLDNATKNMENMKKLRGCVNLLMKDLTSPEHLNCCTILLKFIHKNKKSKFSPEIKLILEGYRSVICKKLLQEIDENNSLISMEAFVLVLKTYLSLGDEENIANMQKHIDHYIGKAVDECENVDPKDSLQLFITVLQYKTVFDDIVTSDFLLKIWNLSKTIYFKYEDTDLNAKLVVAIMEHISNNQFKDISDDLLKMTVSALDEDTVISYKKCLKTWNSIIGCTFNTNKTQIWQQCIEEHLLQICRSCNDNKKDIVDDVINFQLNLVQATHLLLTSTMLETFFYTISQLLRKEEDFHRTFTPCVSIMNSLLKYRQALISDRIPSFLQKYRLMVQRLCKHGNSDKNLNAAELQQASDCAHHLENLTNKFVGLNKHFASVSLYVIADILKEYETVTLYPAVKIHLNNCLYTLIGLCDQHAISCLMRVLSTPSTEIFKLLYETYKKYYRFTGKVCYEIALPAYVQHLCTQFMGYVNEDMRKTRECPLCCKLGKNTNYRLKYALYKTMKFKC